ADAGRPPRPVPDPGDVRGDHLPVVPAHAGDLDLRPPEALAVSSLADPPGRRPGRADRAQPHRRRVAQRRTGPDRPAPADLLRAAGRGLAAQPVRLEIELIRARLRAPFVSAHGSLEDRPLVLVRVEDEDGFVGLGEAAPLAEYHGVNAEDVLDALAAARDILAGPPH